MMSLINIICIVLILSAKSESHTHHLHNSQKERETDGARTPRDHNHFNGDEHNADFDHEAILGSVKEAQEFDDLPPDEAKNRLGLLLEKMDRNSDSYIDREELQSWILRSFRSLSEEESEERMDEVDEDEDGYVTWQEYISETYDIDNPDDIPLLEGAEREEERKLLKDDKDLFDAADRDLDGKLSIKEFFSFTHPEEDPEMLSVLLKQTLDEKDTNQDGQISFQEFIGDKGIDKDQAWLVTEKDKFDMDYDKDKDGILNREEILSWIVPSDVDIAEDEVTHLFSSCDDDHDDMLSFDEILDHHDIFVGSEATDYGDHLHNLERFDDEL